MGSVWTIEYVGIELAIDGTGSDTGIVVVFSPVKEEGCGTLLFGFCVFVLFPCVINKSGFYWINDGLVTSEGKMQPRICSRGNLEVDTAEKENVGRNLATLDRNRGW